MLVYAAVHLAIIISLVWVRRYSSFKCKKKSNSKSCAAGIYYFALQNIFGAIVCSETDKIEAPNVR